jgi:hypothetical protein
MFIRIGWIVGVGNGFVVWGGAWNLAEFTIYQQFTYKPYKSITGGAVVLAPFFKEAKGVWRELSRVKTSRLR